MRTTETPHYPGAVMPPLFTAELVRELSGAMSHYAETRGATDAYARLNAATQRACTEAHQAGMSPERMVLEVKKVFEEIPPADAVQAEGLRAAYDRLLSDCIQSFFTGPSS